MLAAITSFRPLPHAAGALVVAVLATAVASPAAADEADDGAWLLTLEAPGALALDDPQEDRFQPGAMPSIGLYRAFAPWLLAGPRLRAGVLLNGDAPEDTTIMDPGTGGFASAGLGVRLRVPDASAARGTGPWLELVGGGGITGDLGRPTFEVGAGWGFAAGSVDIGPAVRYLHVYQPDDALDGSDAKLLLLGVEVSLFDGRDQAMTLASSSRALTEQPPGDRDGDGIADAEDACPDDAEDMDGFQDTDGCPDFDNDGDRIADLDDACPTQPRSSTASTTPTAAPTRA